MIKDTYRILARDVMQSNNTHKTGINNNDLIIGPSGAGKTRGYVIPNILQANESMIIADTKGDLAKAFRGYLEDKGYKVFVLDFKDTLHSCGYNPLDNIRYDAETERYNEQDILKLVRCMAPNLDSREPFWDEQGRTLLSTLVSYVLENIRPEDRNLVSVQKLFSVWNKRSSGKLFAEVERYNPESFALSKYRLLKRNFEAERMNASIEAFTAQALDIFSFEGTKKMITNPEKIDIKAMGREKTALFLNISDTDRSMDKLVNIFYTQALQMLCEEAESQPGCRLAVPVRFILDDFATNACVPDFDKIISVIRSREIYVSIILQSITQLDGLYGEYNANTILNNCDVLLYLGGQDIHTIDLIGQKTGFTKNYILGMGVNDALLFIRSKKSELVEKYDPTDHPEYESVADYFGRGKRRYEGEKKKKETVPLGFCV